MEAFLLYVNLGWVIFRLVLIFSTFNPKNYAFKEVKLEIKIGLKTRFKLGSNWAQNWAQIQKMDSQQR